MPACSQHRVLHAWCSAASGRVSAATALGARCAGMKRSPASDAGLGDAWGCGQLSGQPQKTYLCTRARGTRTCPAPSDWVGRGRRPPVWRAQLKFQAVAVLSTGAPGRQPARSRRKTKLAPMQQASPAAGDKGHIKQYYVATSTLDSKLVRQRAPRSRRDRSSPMQPTRPPPSPKFPRARADDAAGAPPRPAAGAAPGAGRVLQLP